MCAGQRWYVTYRHFQVTTLTHYHLGILSHEGGNVGEWENGKMGKSHELRILSI